MKINLKKGKGFYRRVSFIIVFLAFFILTNFSQGATNYTWFQTSWNGSQDESSYAYHASDQTGWTNYATTSNVFSIDSDTISLSQDSYSYSDSLYDYDYYDGPSSDAVWDVRSETITLPPNGVSNSDFSWKYPFMGGGHFEAIDWFDATSGVAVGENGMISLITVEGSSVAFPEVNTLSDLNDVSFYDSSYGLIVGDANTILKTTDGGASWTDVSPVGECSNWESVDYESDQVAYIVGSVCSGVNVMKTTDGGASWTDVSPSTSQKDLKGVFFNTLNTGWIVGADGRVRYTDDGASSWTLQDSTVVANLEAVYFTDGSNGWAVGSNGTVVSTIDGGVNWGIDSTGITDTIGDIEMASTTVGYFVTQAGAAYKTTDGSSWSQSNNFGQPLADLSVYSGDVVYVVGQSGEIDSTSNGGTSWSSLTSSPTWGINDVFFASSDMGWAVGGNGTILYTGDGGNTWEQQSSNTLSNLLAVHFAPDDTGNWSGYAVGVDGTVLKNTGGSNWESVTVAPLFLSTVRDVHMTSINDAWIVGDGFDYYTTDGGTNWNDGSYAQTSENFQGVSIVGDRGYIVANGGLILATTDGGLSWSTQSCGAFSDAFEDVYTSNGYNAWAVGSNGTVCYTSDGGGTWNISTPTVNTLYSVGAYGANFVWVVGSSGSLFYSTDGGATFTERSMHTVNNFYSIDVYSPTTIWISGVDDDNLTRGAVHKLSITPTYASSASVISKHIGETDSFATLQTSYTTPTNTDISWYLSRDAAIWESVTPAVEHTFSESGTSIYWRAVLTNTGDGSETPYISSVGVDYYGNYSSGETLTSSWFDIGNTGGYVSNLAWSETLPAGTDLKFQIRTAPDNAGAPNTGEGTSFCGPDDGEELGCSTGTYFTDSTGGETVDNVNQASTHRWVQYEATFETDGSDTPVLDSVTLGYAQYTPPSVPIVLSPTNNMTDVSRTSIFSISFVGDATHLSSDWQLYSDVSLSSLVASVSGATTYKTSITPAQLGVTLGGNTSYWLRARTTNEYGSSDWSSAVKFTTINGSPVFSSISPVTIEEDSTDNSLRLSSYVTDSDNDSLTYSASGNSSSLDVSINSSTSVVTFVPASNYSGSETVAFTASDGYGGEDTVDVSVVVSAVNDAPSAPSAGFSPSQGETTSSRTPTLSWNDASDTEDDTEDLHYVAKVSLTETPSSDESALQYTTYDGVSEVEISSSLTNQTVYYYQVKTVDSEDSSSDWSDVQSFYVDSASEPIVSVIKSVSINQSLSLERLYHFVKNHKPSFLASVIIPFLSTETLAQDVSSWSSMKQGFVLEVYRFAQQASFSYVLLGILLSSVVFSILAVRSPQKLFTFLIRHPSHVFSDVSRRDKKGTFKTSYSQFRRKSQASKGTFFGSALLLIVKFSVAAYLSAFYINPLFVAMGTSDDGVNVSAGDILTYQIAYNNVGSGNATSFVISDSLSDTVSFREGSLYIDDVLKTDANDGDGSYYDSESHSVVFSVGTLGSEESGTVSFSVQVDSDALNSVDNTAVYTYSEVDESVNTNTVSNPVVSSDSSVGSIGYLVYNDIDRDIKIESGESGISNVTVRLYTDTNENGELDGSEIALARLTTTDVNGQYEFSYLEAGTYFISVDEATISSRYSITTSNNPKKVVLSAGQDYRGANFGYALPTSSIGDFVFNDTNNNGGHSSGELGIASVPVSLYRDDVSVGTFDQNEDSLISRTVTDANGQYEFSHLAAATYYVLVDEASSLLSGSTLTTSGNPMKVVVSTDTGFQYRLADFGYYFSDSTAVVSSEIQGEEESTANDEEEAEDSVEDGNSRFLFTPTADEKIDYTEEVAVPKVSKVNGYEYTTDAPIDVHNDQLVLEGSSEPCSRVIIYIHSDTVIKLAQTDVDGNWQLSVDVDEFGEGEHTVLVQGETNGIKSDIDEIAKINVYDGGSPDTVAFIIVLNLAVVFLVLFVTSVAIVFKRR